MSYESGTVDYVELTGNLVSQYQDNPAVLERPGPPSTTT